MRRMKQSTAAATAMLGNGEVSVGTQSKAGRRWWAQCSVGLAVGRAGAEPGQPQWGHAGMEAHSPYTDTFVPRP